MKKENKTLFFMTVMISVILLFSAGFLSGSNYQSNLASKSAQEKVEKLECGVSDKTYTIKIENNTFEPAFIDANRCDKLTFYNNDDKQHGIVFGTHEEHIPYGEFAQEYLQPKERITLKLHKAGVFPFHDHLYEEMKGQLNIKVENK